MNFLKFVLAIFIINCLWFTLDACENSTEEKENNIVFSKSDNEKTWQKHIATDEGCILADGSPYCLRGGHCYRIPSRKKPTCMCNIPWTGRRCNILRSEYIRTLDRCEGDFL